jgi:hypothetical protein
MCPFENGRIGNKRENGAAAITDGVQVARRFEGFHSHKKIKGFRARSLYATTKWVSNCIFRLCFRRNLLTANGNGFSLFNP